MFPSNSLLVEAGDSRARFFSSLHVLKMKSQFFDLDIENPLGGGTLAKFRSPLYY